MRTEPPGYFHRLLVAGAALLAAYCALALIGEHASPTLAVAESPKPFVDAAHAASVSPEAAKAGFASAVKAMQEGKSPAEAMRAAEKAAEKAQEDAGAKSMLLAADPSKMPDTKPFVDAAHAASRSPEAAKAAAASAIKAMQEGKSPAEAMHAAEKAAKEAQEMVGWASAKEMSLLTVQRGKPGDDKDEADEDETDKDESEEEKKSDEQKEWKRMGQAIGDGLKSKGQAIGDDWKSKGQAIGDYWKSKGKQMGDTDWKALGDKMKDMGKDAQETGGWSWPSFEKFWNPCH